MSRHVRPREPRDVPVLARVVAGQQAASGYPLRWPLPYPVEEFVARPGDEAAWVLVDDGEVAGHVAVSRPDAALEADLRAGLGPSADGETLGLLGSLFVAPRVRGTGAGRLLLTTAVGWLRDHGRLPVLDVLPTNRDAHAAYVRGGWQEVGRSRPGWLPDGAPDVVLMVLRDRRP